MDARHSFTFDVTKLADDGGGPRYHAVMSDETVDSYGDIVRAAGWQLDRFAKHPVLLTGHDYSDTESHIGRWEDVKVVKTRKSLEGVARYYSGKGNDRADWAEYIASIGEAAFSVGFQPQEWELLGEGATDWFGPFEFLKQDLLETSHVNVPANPSAVQNALKGTFGPREYRTAMRLLESAQHPQQLELTSVGGDPLTTTTYTDSTNGYTGGDLQVKFEYPYDEERIAQRVIELLREQGHDEAAIPDSRDDLESALLRAVLGQLRKD